jgi:hypothetical protein
MKISLRAMLVQMLSSSRFAANPMSDDPHRDTHPRSNEYRQSQAIYLQRSWWAMRDDFSLVSWPGFGLRVSGFSLSNSARTSVNTPKPRILGSL